MTSKRILAFVIDFVLLIVTQEITILLFNFCYINMLLWALFFCRDGFKGQGIGKRIMGIVVTHKQVAANPLRCLIRSVFYLLWFVELIVLFVNNGRRFGDIITRCNVVNGYSDKFNNYNIILCIITFAILCLLYIACTKYFSTYSLINMQ